MKKNEEKTVGLNGKYTIDLKFARYAVIMIAFFFMLMLAINNYCIWDDEVFTLNIVDNPMSNMWGLIVDDLVHPPLYYYLLKLFLIPFSSNHLSMIQASKIFSIIWVVILMLQGSYLIEKQHSSFSALLFTLFLSGNMSIGYSVEIRMYSMAMCFSALTALYAERISVNGTNREWFFLVLFTMLSAYTNYFGLISVSFFWIWLLFKTEKNYKLVTWFRSAGGCIVLFLPWIITTIINHKSVTDYSVKMTLTRAVSLFAFPFSCRNDLVSIILILFTIFILICSFLLVKPDSFSVLCVINPILIGIVCIIASSVFRKFVIGRYLLPGWGVFWAGVSILTAKLNYKKLIAVSIIILDCFSFYFIYQNEDRDKQICNNMIETFSNENQPVYADKEVQKMLVFLTGNSDFSDSMEKTSSGRFYTYHWSETWLKLRDNGYNIVAEFPLSAHEIDVYQSDN